MGRHGVLSAQDDSRLQLPGSALRLLKTLREGGGGVEETRYAHLVTRRKQVELLSLLFLLVPTDQLFLKPAAW